MKTHTDSTDKAGDLIRQAGPEIPPQGMTERIMNRIEVVTLKRSQNIIPIISIRGWIFVAASAIVIIMLCISAGNAGALNGSILPDAGQWFASLPMDNNPLRFNFQVPKPLLFGLMGLLLWFSLDFLLNTLKWKRQSPK
jgi:hypothetical protein